MILKVLGSSSKGNCYILEGDKESLIIEAGVSFKEVKRSLNFHLEKVIGCLVTHEHLDHCKYSGEMALAGIDLYMSEGTKKNIDLDHHRINIIKSLEQFQIGGFIILPFDVKHDCDEPLGFLIRHEEVGFILFATDTYYLEYKFEHLNYILIECNYSLDILNKNIEQGKIHPAFKTRVLQSHFELENAKSFFKANDLKDVRGIVLLHLSDGNSNAAEFKSEIEKITRKPVYIADKGLTIDIGLYPF